jgi:hypothetical protein
MHSATPCTANLLGKRMLESSLYRHSPMNGSEERTILFVYPSQGQIQEAQPFRVVDAALALTT